MIIRQAKFPSDFEEIFFLNSIISPDESRDYFLKDVNRFKGFIFVAQQSETIVGFVSLSYPFWDKIGLILHLVVHQDYQSGGVGSALMKYVIEESRSVGLRFITVRTAEWNTRAIKFYKQNGFTIKATFNNYFGDDNNMVWLERDVRSL